jgi:aminopeptidase N
LIVLKAPDADSLYRAEIARDTTPERLRSAFVAGAAFATAENKARLYERFFADKALNEEWVTASLGAFNDPLHSELTLPYLKPALERATWIRDNRRIFFLPGWLQSFIESQNSPERCWSWTLSSQRLTCRWTCAGRFCSPAMSWSAPCAFGAGDLRR